MFKSDQLTFNLRINFETEVLIPARGTLYLKKIMTILFVIPENFQTFRSLNVNLITDQKNQFQRRKNKYEQRIELSQLKKSV